MDKRALLRLEQVPGVKEIASLIKLPEIPAVASPTVNVGNFAVALAILAISRITRFHDRISDFFNIRARFDRANILLPLAVMSGAKLSPRQVQHLKRDRQHLMRETFYKYASSRSEKPLVDKHDIESALEAWVVYWVALEGLFILASFAALSVVAKSVWLLTVFWVTSMAFLLFMHLRYTLLEKRADPQTQQIAGDAEANAANRAAFEDFAH